MRDAGTKSIPLALFAKKASEATAREGLRVGRYELLTPIARGGMAEVWSARFLGDLGFSRVVALKVIRPEYAEDAAFRAAFFEEARIAGRLRHANVVEVLELGEEGPLLFQAMALIEGDSASRLMREHKEKNGTGTEESARLPLRVTSKIVLDMLAGLHAAHELTDDDGVGMKLVHRDVSPHNILVGIDGVSKLGDFGVAKFLGRKMIETDAGQVRGKPGYLAPEQLERKPIDRRTDVFAAGVVVWEMITARKLFRTDEARPALADPLEGPIPDPRDFATQLAPPIAEVAMRALARDPAARFETARAMAEALELAATGASELGTANDVARLVNELCGTRLEMERGEIRNAMRGSNRAPIPAPRGVTAPMLPPAPALGPRPDSIRRGLADAAGVGGAPDGSTGSTASLESLEPPTVEHETKQVSPRIAQKRKRARLRTILAMAGVLLFSALITAVLTSIVTRREKRPPRPPLEQAELIDGIDLGTDTATIGAGSPDRSEKPVKSRRAPTRQSRKKQPRPGTR